MANYDYVHNLWQSVRGTPDILMFWLFPENGSISEQNWGKQGINSSYNPVKFWIQKRRKKKRKKIAMYQNYPLALIKCEDVTAA